PAAARVVRLRALADHRAPRPRLAAGRLKGLWQSVGSRIEAERHTQSRMRLAWSFPLTPSCNRLTGTGRSCQSCKTCSFKDPPRALAQPGVRLLKLAARVDRRQPQGPSDVRHLERPLHLKYSLQGSRQVRARVAPFRLGFRFIL